MKDRLNGKDRSGRASLARLETPFLALDAARMQRNIVRLRDRTGRLGVGLRPHLKTGKSVEVARRLFDGGVGPATVSTLREAEYFADAGFTDMLYAVGIAPHKLERVVALRKRGVDLGVILDSPEQARAVAEISRRCGERLPALIEIDCDGHRGGLPPDDPRLIDIAGLLEKGGAQMRGVLDHAGESYHSRSEAELIAAAEKERVSAVAAAERVRAAGLPCPVVSVGSTPTAHFARRLDGVTEVRAGVYVFFDLVMAGIGVCRLEDLALSVVTTVIGRRPEKGWILVDAGWMAMSRDRGTARQRTDQGYGLAAAMDGTLFPDLLMTDANQEHGTLAVRPGSGARLPDLAIGTRLRIYPNHACATAAQFDCYHVVETGGESLTAVWTRIRGW